MTQSKKIIMIFVLCTLILGLVQSMESELKNLNGNQQQEEIFFSYSSGGSVNDAVLQNVQLSNPAQFVAAQESEYNRNWQLTVLNDIDPNSGGWACFGYYPNSQLPQLASNPNTFYYSNGISLCSDNTQNSLNGLGYQPTCEGEFTYTTGDQYVISFTETGVTIGKTDNSYSCAFHLEGIEHDDYLPWVEIAGPYSVSTEILPVPQIQIQQIVDESGSSRDFVSLSTGGSSAQGELSCVGDSNPTQFISSAQGSNFDVILISDLSAGVNGWVCFGFVSDETRQNIEQDPDTMYGTNSISLCSDNTQNNYNNLDQSNLDVNCVGSLDNYLQVGTVFQIRNHVDQLVISSLDRQFTCTYERPDADGLQLYPWVEIASIHAVQVEVLETEPLQIPSYFFSSSSSGAQVQEHQLGGDSSISPLQFQSNQAGAGFDVTLNSDLTDGRVCFGYVQQSTSDLISSNPDSSYFEQSVSLCTDNQQHNFNGEQLPFDCRGTLPTQAGSQFIVRASEVGVTISTMDGSYFCSFPRDDSLQLLPWVEITGNNNVAVDAPSNSIPIFTCLNPHPPTGLCAILYADCNFQGCFSKVCNEVGDLDSPMVVRSIYVPEGKVVNVWEERNFHGDNMRSFFQSVECIELEEPNELPTQLIGLSKRHHHHRHLKRQNKNK